MRQFEALFHQERDSTGDPAVKGDRCAGNQHGNEWGEVGSGVGYVPRLHAFMWGWVDSSRIRLLDSRGSQHKP